MSADYTPGRHLWLQTLERAPGTIAGAGKVAEACIRRGLTRLRTARQTEGGHYLTDAGKAKLEEWNRNPPARRYFRRDLHAHEVLALIEVNGWSLVTADGLWAIEARDAGGDRLLAYGTTIAKAVEVAIDAAQVQGTLELPPDLVDAQDDGPRYAHGGFVAACSALHPGEVAARLSGQVVTTAEEVIPHPQAPRASLGLRPSSYTSCPDCDGKGQRGQSMCARCDGAGRARVGGP